MVQKLLKLPFLVLIPFLYKSSTNWMLSSAAGSLVIITFIYSERIRENIV